MTAQTAFAVNGLNCSGCVKTLTKKMTAVDGVESVEVDLVSGGTSRVTVVYDDALDATSVRAALTGAGYQLEDAVPSIEETA